MHFVNILRVRAVCCVFHFDYLFIFTLFSLLFALSLSLTPPRWNNPQQSNILYERLLCWCWCKMWLAFILIIVIILSFVHFICSFFSISFISFLGLPFCLFAVHSLWKMYLYLNLCYGRTCLCACARSMPFISATFTERRRSEQRKKKNAKIINKTKQKKNTRTWYRWPLICFSFSSKQKPINVRIASDFLIWTFLISILEREKKNECKKSSTVRCFASSLCSNDSNFKIILSFLFAPSFVRLSVCFEMFSFST